MLGTGRQHKLKPYGPSGRVSSTLTSGTMKKTRDELERIWHNTKDSPVYYDGECCHDIEVSETGWHFQDEAYTYWGPYATHEIAWRYCFGYWTHIIEPVHLRPFSDITECFKFFTSMLDVQEKL